MIFLDYIDEKDKFFLPRTRKYRKYLPEFIR